LSLLFVIPEGNLLLPFVCHSERSEESPSLPLPLPVLSFVILGFAQNLRPCPCLFFCLSFPKGICFCLLFVILSAAKNPRIFSLPVLELPLME